MLNSDEKKNPIEKAKAILDLIPKIKENMIKNLKNLKELEVTQRIAELGIEIAEGDKFALVPDESSFLTGGIDENTVVGIIYKGETHIFTQPVYCYKNQLIPERSNVPLSKYFPKKRREFESPSSEEIKKQQG